MWLGPTVHVPCHRLHHSLCHLLPPLPLPRPPPLRFLLPCFVPYLVLPFPFCTKYAATVAGRQAGRQWMQNEGGAAGV